MHNWLPDAVDRGGMRTKISNSGVCLFLIVVGVAVAQSTACSSPFHSCYETRTCAPKAEDEAGAAGEDSYSGVGGRHRSNGGASGAAGAARVVSDSGADAGGMSGEGGGGSENGDA